MTCYDEAFEKAQHALQVARQIGRVPYSEWRFSAARQALLEGLEIAIRIGSHFSQVWASWLLADLLRWQGEYELALQNGNLPLKSR